MAIHVYGKQKIHPLGCGEKFVEASPFMKKKIKDFVISSESTGKPCMGFDHFLVCVN